MGFEIQPAGDVQIIRIDKEISMRRRLGETPDDSPQRPRQDVPRALADLVKSGKHKLLVDLSQVPFIDSAGLGQLLLLKKRTNQAGGDIHLLKPTDRIIDLLDMCRLRTVFEIFEDESKALAAFDA